MPFDAYLTPNHHEDLGLIKGYISTKEAQKAIEYMRNNHKKNRISSIYHLCFVVFENGSNSIIGWCGLDRETAGLISYAFDEAHVPFVNGGCDKDNVASYKVMMKIGMSKNGFESNGDPLFIIDDELYRKNSTWR